MSSDEQSATPDLFLEVASLPGVADAVEASRAAVDRLRSARVLRRQAEQVAAESALRGARASAALEGADLPLDALRRVLRAGGVFPGPEGPHVQGALRVAIEVGQQQDTWRRAPLQVLARLHALAAADLSRPDELGRPRPVPGVAERLAALGELLARPSDAPAVVVAAVVHGEILAAEAFSGANGVVARAAARLVMVTRGLDPGAVSVPEVGHVELGIEAYAAASAGYRAGGADGVAAWVISCADAVALGAREGLAVCESLGRG